MAMMSHIIALAVVLVTADALSFDASAAKENPVSRVVSLLKDMQSELEKEADADEAVYEKLACWCETNDKGKTKAIADAVTRMDELDATINKMAAKSQTLQVEIKALEKEIAADQKALDTAVAMREKEQGEFLATEKEMIASIRSLNQAVTVLSGHNGGKKTAFLANQVVVNAYATARELMDKHYDILSGVITPSERKVIASFMQAPKDNYLDAEPTFNQAYAPQSGEIFGILRQMKETFENDLSGSQKDELAAQEAFANLKKAKEGEIKAGEESVETKSQQLAEADETLARSKEDLEDTKASWSADKKFLMDLKVKCKMTDKEWEERQKLRQSELSAVAKAIEILSSDEAREQFAKTVDHAAAFLQTKLEKDTRRVKASSVISKAATKNPKFSALVVAVRLDPFPKVKKAIDDMVAQLLKEKDEEIKEKDFCTEELNKNERSDAKETHTKKKLENKIAATEQAIKDQQSAIDTLDAEMADLNKQREKASADRKAEGEAFDQEVVEQKKAAALLKSALDTLKDVYAKAALVQQAPPVGGPAPKDFATYEKSRASSGILAMIEQIITDTELMVKEAQHNEQLAQDQFTKFVQTVNESLAANDDAKVDLTSQKAQSDKDLIAAQGELKGTNEEIAVLDKTAGDLHKQCDFLVANFEVTQKARDEEVESLRSAKAFLSGQQA
jgi:DNA repair exonuclease SbcCD ATPase subunit